MFEAAVEKVDRISLFFSRLGIYASGVMILVVTLMIFTNILTRYLFNFNMPFVEEWSTLMMVPMSYLGLGYTLRNDKHITADLVIARLSVENRNRVRLLIGFIALAVMLFVLERAFELFTYSLERGTTSSGPMRTPLWLPNAAMVTGLVIFVADIFFWILHSLMKMRGKKGLNFDM